MYFVHFLVQRTGEAFAIYGLHENGYLFDSLVER